MKYIPMILELRSPNVGDIPMNQPLISGGILFSMLLFLLQSLFSPPTLFVWHTQFRDVPGLRWWYGWYGWNLMDLSTCFFTPREVSPDITSSIQGFVNVPFWGFWTSLSSICWRLNPLIFGWCSIRTFTNPCYRSYISSNIVPSGYD